MVILHETATEGLFRWMNLNFHTWVNCEWGKNGWTGTYLWHLFCVLLPGYSSSESNALVSRIVFSCSCLNSIIRVGSMFSPQRWLNRDTHDWVLLRVFSFCCGTLSPRICTYTMVLDSHTSRTFNADEIRSNFLGCLYSVRRTSLRNELKKNLCSLLKHINFYFRNKIRCCVGRSRCDFDFKRFWLVEKHKMQLVVIVHLKSTSISYHAKSQTETQTYNSFGRNVKSEISQRKNRWPAENGIN